MNRVRAALAVAALLLVAYAVLRAAARPAPFTTLALPAAAPAAFAPATAASRREPPTLTRLRAALAALDRARAAAYADPVTADPDLWAARTCACRAEDVRRLRVLAAARRALRGQRTTVTTLTLLRAGPASAHLLVTDRSTAYTAVAAHRTVARWPASGLCRWRVTLVLMGGRWRFGGVARAP